MFAVRVSLVEAPHVEDEPRPSFETHREAGMIAGTSADRARPPKDLPAS